MTTEHDPRTLSVEQHVELGSDDGPWVVVDAYCDVVATFTVSDLGEADATRFAGSRDLLDAAEGMVKALQRADVLGGGHEFYKHLSPETAALLTAIAKASPVNTITQEATL